MFSSSNAIRWTLVARRAFSKTSTLRSNQKQVKMLQKIMSGRDKGKRRWVNSDELPKSLPASRLSTVKGQGKESNRRVSVLNKLFMKNITDLMSTGDFALAIAGKGIQISHVRVTPDFQGIIVYWIASGDQEDSVVDVALKSISGSLRHELSQLRLMGEVPRITFVRDRIYSKAAEIDILLRKADFGDTDDWSPTDPTLFMRSNLKLEMKLSPEVVTQIAELENTNEFVEEIDLPTMRHDIFGIDHSAIMKKITKNMKQTKLAWDQYEDKSADGQEFSKKVNDINKSIDKLNEEETLRDNFVKYLDRKQFSKKTTPERKRTQREGSSNVNDWDEDVELEKKFDEEDFVEDELIETSLKRDK